MKRSISISCQSVSTSLPSHEIEAADLSTNSVELGMLGSSGA